MGTDVVKLTDTGEAERLSQRILSAWNVQDVDGVVACYTEDCI